MSDVTVTVEIKISAWVPGHPVGSTTQVASDSEGTPLDPTWRRRLKDGSCEVVPKEKPKRRARRSEPPTGDRSEES